MRAAYTKALVGAWLVLWAGFWACALAAAVAVPPLTGRVVDQTGTLDAATRTALERRLAEFEARKGSQIAVLLVPTTRPETVEQYALRVAETWKLGRKGVDDGALLLVAKDDRTLRIEVGYGLEGALTDATANRIIEEIIVPRFRAGDFAGGIREGVERMIAVVEGEPLPPPAARPAARAPQGFGELVPLILLVALVAGGMLRAMFGRLMGALAAGGLVGVLAWFLVGSLFVVIGAALIAFLFTLLGGGMGGMGGGLPRGGYYGGLPGGGGGSVFRGGGGGFGGGGASGRW